MRRLKINKDCDNTVCDKNRNNCPKYILNKVTQNKNKACSINDCNHKNKDLFRGLEQKMVDTLIACDIISLSEDDDYSGIFVISDDNDHFPSVALAIKKQEYKKIKNIENITIGIKNERKFENITNLLSPLNIKTHLLK